MKYFLGLLAISVVTWVFTVPWQGSLDQNMFFWREHFMFLTGSLTLAAMAMLVITAMKLPFIESKLGGLDKVYSLHKWIGIVTTVTVFLHWALNELPHWMINLGLLQSRGRPPRVPGEGPVGFNWVGFGHELGAWVFYAMITLIVVSLIKKIPYRIFRWSHRLMPIVFTAGALHSVLLLSDELIYSAYGAFVFFTCAIGVVGSISSLLGYNGKHSRFRANIVAITPDTSDVTRLTVGLSDDKNKFNYLPGQFVLLKAKHLAGYNPFTVIRYDAKAQQLELAIKKLGKKTRTLRENISVNENVYIEGPYGRFTLPEASKKSAWLATGIGITPFLAWMEALVERKETRDGTTLTYCVNNESDAPMIEKVKDLCVRCGIHLVLHESKTEQEFLKPEQIAAYEPETVWFCGAQPMRKKFSKAMKNIPFKYEKFDFR